MVAQGLCASKHSATYAPGLITCSIWVLLIWLHKDCVLASTLLHMLQVLLPALTLANTAGAFDNSYSLQGCLPKEYRMSALVWCCCMSLSTKPIGIAGGSGSGSGGGASGGFWGSCTLGHSCLGTNLSLSPPSL